MKKYNKGFTAGAFDLFHYGHLALLKKCKEQCSYLLVGVLSDEYIKYTKGSFPYIPLEERIEIVKAIKYVDEVVVVDFHNTLKRDAVKLYNFDCCFSGDDHAWEPLWHDDKRILNSLGVDLIFFPYTKCTSSTKIKKLIDNSLI